MGFDKKRNQSAKNAGTARSDGIFLALIRSGVFVFTHFHPAERVHWKCLILLKKPRVRRPGTVLAVLSVLLSFPAHAKEEDGFSVIANRVDDKGQVKVSKVKGQWLWKDSASLPCVSLGKGKKEIRKLNVCLSEISTVVPVIQKDKPGEAQKVKARYVFDLPFEYPVVIASPECDTAGIKVEPSSLVRGYGIVGVRCGASGPECAELGEGKSVCWDAAGGAGQVSTSNGLKVIKDTDAPEGRDPHYLVLNRSGAVAGKFVMRIPLPVAPSPTPAVVVTEATPVPSPTPKPKIRRYWVFGGYLGVSDVTHQNRAADGSGQVQNWSGKQAALYFNANRFSPVGFGLIPEIEMRMNQGGGLSGVSVAGAYLHKNLLRSRKLALLAGLGGEIMGMNGEGRYGIISSLGWAGHLVLRPFDRSFFVAATYGPLLTPVPSLQSFWAGVIADVRLRLFGRAFHVAADASWVKVPAGVSAVNADYTSNRYGLMLGYYFGE